MTLLKTIGKGLLYIIGLPFFLIVLTGVAIYGIFMLLFMFIKSIVFFFTGRSLDDDLPEDIRAKEIKNGRNRPANENPAPVVTEEPPVQPAVEPAPTRTIEDVVFGPEEPSENIVETIEEPVQEEVLEDPVVEQEPVEEEPEPEIDTPEVVVDTAPETTEINIGEYVPNNTSRFINDEDDEEEDSGVTISFGDEDE